MVGRTVSHYRIVRELGAGGMGVVFAAEDVRLGRQVAIKFVPDAMADKQLFERLRSEARTASALNHPNICILHDIGDDEGRPFIVMELLQGRTLRERLTAGPLKVHETLDIGVQVADALEAAHRQHIIHRDIKPANLFLTDRGSVKILDFGLAKVVAQQPSALTAAPTGLTTAGMTLGTVSYMSPEQVTGDPLDGRSDLFSFGVVLYECVTGHQPFKGKTSGVILSEILNGVPPSPLVLNPELPLRLQEIITNCLEKDRELRYQDSAALRTDLKRLKRDLESGPRSTSHTAVSIETPPPAPEPKTRKKYGPVVAAIAIVSTFAALYMFRTLPHDRDDAPPVASAQSAPKPLDDRGQATTAPALPEPSTATAAPEPSTTPPSPATPRNVAPAPERRQQEPARAASLPPSLTPPLVAETLPSLAPAPVPPPPLPVVPQPEAPKSVAAPTPAAPVPQATAPAADDDDSAIRRVIASYARAIESKDLDAFRAVKPNLSDGEQRRLQDSFSAVASQKVDITVLSIEHRASTALVKVRRRDTLTAGGRAQTSDSQQTMTVIRSGAGWVISEIGR